MFDTRAQDIPAPDTQASGADPRRMLFKAADGAELIGHLYRPAGPPRAVVVLSGATGVPQTYYANFARWAAETRGLAVLTYDYRATELSATGTMRAAQADMIDWGVSDPQAARAAVRRIFPGVPIWALGHSLGGMLLPMQADRKDLARVITVASGRVHVRDHPWPYRVFGLLFWYGLGPLATALMGYLPGRRLRFGADLPAAAYWQWRRWCTREASFMADIGAGLPQPRWGGDDAPVRMIGFHDDELIPLKCVARLSQGYSAGPLEVVDIDPSARGLGTVGHLSAFSRRNKVLWPDILGEEN